MITVLLADDQDLIRMGLRNLLENTDGYAVVGEASDGLMVVDQAVRTRPHVILMDIRMPGIDGLQATKRIVARPELAETRVIVLTTFERDEYVFEALQAGASGFLLKNTPPAKLLEAIATVADGGALLAPSITRTVIAEFANRAPRSVRPHPLLKFLTEREREVVGLVAEGLSNSEIGDRLVVSPATARTHVSRAMIKLNARDRAQLVVIAYQSGLA